MDLTDSRLALGLIAALAFGPAQAGAFDLEGYLETVREAHALPALAAGVAKDGTVIAKAAVGVRAQGTSIPVGIGDRFHIGSNGKAMTATLAGMMVDAGKLRWDSTIGDVLGAQVENMNPALASVTLEQLLSHSSGIPTDTAEMIEIYFSDDAFDYNPADLRRRALEAWKHNAPVVPEGSPFQYSNFGYMIAGVMIETVAGAPWEALIHERIFAPLDLEQAGLGPQATHGLIDAPVGHRFGSDGVATPMFWGAAADMPALLGPVGNVHMTVGEFTRWAAWNAGGGARGPALVSPETLAEIQRPHVQTPHRENPPPGTPQDGGYGLGWGSVAFDWADRPLMVHNGSNEMNLATIVVDTPDDLGIVVMTNFPGADAAMAVSEVIERLYGEYGGG